jgi:hypothetical protein
MITLPRRIAALASITAAVAALCLSGTPAVASHIGESLTLDQQFVATNNQLVNALSQWDKMPASVREARIANLVALAARRQEHMIALLQKNPTVAAARMMPKELRDRMPAQAAAYVEREVSAQGTLFASVSDNFAQGLSKQQFKFQASTGGAPQDIYLADASASERDMLKWAGKKLSLNAVRIGEHLALLDKRQVQLEAAGSTTSSTGSIVAATTAVQGDQKTLSILVNFNDKAVTCTAADVGNRLFGSTGATVNNNYRESSRGMVSFSGQAVGPYTINYSSTGSCDYSAWATAAEAAARAAGVDPSQFAHVNYVTPSNSTCGWSGLAYMPGRQSWVQSCGSTGVYSHELGHNISLHHAGTPTSEYGDASDPMGGAQVVDHNAANRTMAGWMPAGTVTDVGTGGSYSVTTVSNITSVGVPQVLRFVKVDTSEYYYVSVREAMGLDATLSGSFVNTISVHRAGGTLPTKTYLMQQLAAGQSFTDATNGITITNQGVAAGVATVAVTMAGPVCTRSAPAVSLSPASQTGAPGAAKAFTLTLVNKNSAACGSSTFALAQVLPAGFGGTFSASSLAVGAGASASATWTVSSASASLDGAYSLDASARDTASGLSTTAHGSYTVYRDSTAPTLSITSPSPTLTTTTYTTRTNLSIAASASDASGVQAVEFYGDGMLLARDTSAPYSASWNLRKAGKGVHTIKARAIDNAGNTTEQSISITVN